MVPLNPELRLEGFQDDISFPISDREVMRIKLASGCENISRSLSLDSWEVPASGIRISNPLWDEFLHSILDIVASDMGIDNENQGLGVENPELVLYEAGSTQRIDPW